MPRPVPGLKGGAAEKPNFCRSRLEHCGSRTWHGLCPMKVEGGVAPGTKAQADGHGQSLCRRTELHARKGSCRQEQHRSVDICRGVQEELRPGRLRVSKSVKMIYPKMHVKQSCIASIYVDKISQACVLLVLSEDSSALVSAVTSLPAADPIRMSCLSSGSLLTNRPFVTASAIKLNDK